MHRFAFGSSLNPVNQTISSTSSNTHQRPVQRVPSPRPNETQRSSAVSSTRARGSSSVETADSRDWAESYRTRSRLRQVQAQTHQYEIQDQEVDTEEEAAAMDAHVEYEP